MKIAVAHPVYNNRFNILSRMVESGSTVTVSDSGISLPQSTNGLGDALRHTGFLDLTYNSYPHNGEFGYPTQLIARSTNSTYENEYESFPVDLAASSGGNNNYTGLISMKKSFTSSDKWTLLTMGLPDGWWGDIPGGANKDFSFGRIIVHPDDGIDMTGLSGPHAFLMKDISGSSTNRCALNIGKLRAATTYTLTVKYQGVNYSGGSSVIGVVDTVYGVLGTPASMSASSWTTVSTTFTTSSDQTDREHYIIIQHPAGVTADALCIESISLSCFPFRTSDPVIDLTDLIPDHGSVRVKRLGPVQKKNLDNWGRESSNSGTGKLLQLQDTLPVTRYQISMNFTKVPDSGAGWDVFRDHVNHLQQGTGALFNLYPELSGLPSCLTGRLMSKIVANPYMDNFRLTTFRLDFEEVPV